jgi:hypothetical protein
LVAKLIEQSGEKINGLDRHYHHSAQRPGHLAR